MSDQINRFQRRPRGSQAEIGFEVTGGFLTESGEQRRQICQRAIDEAMRKLGKAITVEGDIQYVPDYDRGFPDSKVRVDLNVPVSVDPSGRTALTMTVPIQQDWSEMVIRVVLNYVIAWATENA